MINFNKYFFLIILLFHNILISNKHVIGSRLGAGLFCNLAVTLDHIIWAQQNNKIPVVYWTSKNSLYYHSQGHNGSIDNVWEYYFEPINTNLYNINDFIDNRDNISGIITPINSLYAITLRNNRNEFIKKYVKVKPVIIDKVNNFFQKFIEGKKTIGIHLRGTDKFNDVTPVDFYSILNYANNFKGYQFFIATDEERLLEIAKKHLNENVIFYPSTRSSTNEAIHVSVLPNKAILGEEVLIECLLLSKCDVLLHTLSCVSTAAHYFNPNLKAILFRSGHSPLNI